MKHGTYVAPQVRQLGSVNEMTQADENDKIGSANDILTPVAAALGINIDGDIQPD